MIKRSITLALLSASIACSAYDPATLVGHEFELKPVYNFSDLMPAKTALSVQAAKGANFTMMVAAGDVYLGWVGITKATNPVVKRLHFNGSEIEQSDVELAIPDDVTAGRVKTIYYLGNDTQGQPFVFLPEMPAEGNSTAEAPMLYSCSVSDAGIQAEQSFAPSAIGGQTRQVSVYGSISSGSFSMAGPVWEGVWDDIYEADNIHIALWQYDGNAESGSLLSSAFTNRPFLSVQSLGENFLLLDSRGYGQNKPAVPDPRVYTMASSGSLSQYSDLYLPTVSQPDVANGSHIFNIADSWFIIFPSGSTTRRTYTIAWLPQYPYSLNDAEVVWTLREEFPQYDPSNGTFKIQGGIYDTNFINVIPESEHTVAIYILTATTGLAKYMMTDRTLVQTNTPHITVPTDEPEEIFTISGQPASRPLTPGVYIRRTPSQTTRILIK